LKQIAIFASGSGSNAENLIRHYLNSDKAKVAVVFTNNAQAGVIARAEKYAIPVVVFNRDQYKQDNFLETELENRHIDYILLAGFLWLFPINIVRKYPHKILNIHPALLPKYGGKGMYGEHVHRAVLTNGDNIHGVTVHYVNENFDEGEILLQQRFDVAPTDDIQLILRKIHEVETELYPKAADILISGDN